MNRSDSLREWLVAFEAQEEARLLAEIEDPEMRTTAGQVIHLAAALRVVGWHMTPAFMLSESASRRGWRA